MENLLQKLRIRSPCPHSRVVQTQCRPGVHRRIYIGKVPLVSRHLAVRMRVPFAEKQDQLILAVVGINPRECRSMEGEIPGAVVGILPCVRHREDITVEDVLPILIPDGMSGRRRWFGGIPLLPLGLNQIVKLLGPKKSRIGLPGHVFLLGIE